MMRLLFLCLILRAAVGSSEESEGSADGDDDDEDLGEDIKPGVRSVVDMEPGVEFRPGTVEKDKSTAGDGGQNEFITIVVVAAVGVVVLSIVAIAAVVLVRRRMHSRQQGIYSVPVEQDQKRAV